MRNIHTSADRQTYTEVGEEGIEEGEREPTLCVRRCCELRFDNFRSRVGLARFELEVMCRRSVGERLLDIEVSASCEGRLKSAMEDMTRTSWRVEEEELVREARSRLDPQRDIRSHFVFLIIINLCYVTSNYVAYKCLKVTPLSSLYLSRV